MDMPAVHLFIDRLPPGPWVFGRQVEATRDVPDGSLVEVIDAAGRFCGHGLYNGTSDIRVRMLNRGKKSAMANPRQFLLKQLADAVRLRKRTLRIPDVSNAWRAVFAEGRRHAGFDRGPLSRAPWYASTTALGFWNLREDIAWGLGELCSRGLLMVHKMPEGAARSEGGIPWARWRSHLQTVWIEEHGLQFPVELATGHKTGLVLRPAGQSPAGWPPWPKTAMVLDLCCNRGGFALHAAKAGAKRVTAVDLDEVALEAVPRKRRPSATRLEHRLCQHADAFDVLRAAQTAKSLSPSLIILDPHKLIRGQGNMEEGRRKYSDYEHPGAWKLVAPGGLIATFSCSGALDLPGFLGILFQSARRAERGLRLLVDPTGPRPDHPATTRTFRAERIPKRGPLWRWTVRTPRAP